MNTILKNLSLTLFGIICFLGANKTNGQRLQHNVPIVVTDAFQKKFPDKEPVWFSEYQGRYDEKLVYEARFMFDNRYSKAFYENEGKMLAFATVVEKTELPQKVIDYMKEKYPSFPIAESLLVTYANNDIHFEVGIYIENNFLIQVFNKQGDFIKMNKG